MAKVLFIQNFRTEYLGIMYLSSALKKKGHNCAVAIGKDYKKELLMVIMREKPDIIGIPIMTFSHEWGRGIAGNIKKDFPSVKIIFGGPHPTYFHNFIEEENVDIMVVGEAEEAFAELVDAISQNKPITSIKNVHSKINGVIYRNPVRPIISNLDSLEFPDREIYKPCSWLVGRKEMQGVISSRGCPFKCTYCYNNASDNYYGTHLRFVRTRGIGSIIQELEQIKKEINPKKIMFYDDFFGFSGKEWLNSFLEEYRQKIRIPFLAVMRADMIARNPELAEKLKEAGCFQICFGIETGNEILRNEVIKKYLKNEDIINASSALHKQGIYIRTCNLLGIPHETIENIYETIELNQRIKAEFPHPFLFYPFPKTELAQMAVDEGLIEEGYFKTIGVKSFHDGSVLNLKNKTEVENLHKLFQLAISFPSLTPFIKRWAKHKHPKINYAVFKMVIAFKFKKYYKLSLSRAIIDFFR